MPDTVAVLRSPATVRERCARVAAFVAEGGSRHFTLDRSRLPDVALRVARITRARYPDLKIALHSRWRHFDAGGVDRLRELDARLAGRVAAAMARARIELALISVLLDAGAGPEWHYNEARSGRRFARSEGLAVASFRAFMDGRFSSDAGDPVRVDAAALVKVDARTLADIFQASEANPLVGLEGRAALLRRLGEALRAQPEVFTSQGRPGHLFDALTHHHHVPQMRHHHPAHDAAAASFHHQVSAARILGALLDAFSAIFTGGSALNGVPLGDAWPHAQLGWVPLHKLSQWLAYSLVEPFEWAGVHVHGLDELTGLAEYRNGGLFVDAGVVVPRDADYAARTYEAHDEWVVEWRALTVALLDELAPLVRAELGLTLGQAPLARILEGGTWTAGRQIAAERRTDGAPPVRIASDGTLF